VKLPAAGGNIKPAENSPGRFRLIQIWFNRLGAKSSEGNKSRR
jgi:hypothetical protein